MINRIRTQPWYPAVLLGLLLSLLGISVALGAGSIDSSASRSAASITRPIPGSSESGAITRREPPAKGLAAARSSATARGSEAQ